MLLFFLKRNRGGEILLHLFIHGENKTQAQLEAGVLADTFYRLVYENSVYPDDQRQQSRFFRHGVRQEFFQFPPDAFFKKEDAVPTPAVRMEVPHAGILPLANNNIPDKIPGQGF